MTSLQALYALDLLTEASFTPADIPEFFYVSLKFKNFDQLAQQRLTGVVGLTSDKKTAINFSHSSPIMLIMPGKQTVELNSLSMVNYDNLDYLVSRNLQAFRRVSETTGETLFFDFAIDLFRSIEDNVPVEQWSPMWAEKRARKFAQKIIEELDGLKINSLNNLCSYVLGKLPPEFRSVKFDYIKRVFIELLRNSVQRVQQEKEWIVKNKVLNVPNGTTLRINDYSLQRNNHDPQKMINDYNLSEFYKIEIVS
jgi:hypothetical protein